MGELKVEGFSKVLTSNKGPKGLMWILINFVTLRFTVE